MRGPRLVAAALAGLAIIVAWSAVPPAHGSGVVPPCPTLPSVSFPCPVPSTTTSSTTSTTIAASPTPPPAIPPPPSPPSPLVPTEQPPPTAIVSEPTATPPINPGGPVALGPLVLAAPHLAPEALLDTARPTAPTGRTFVTGTGFAYPAVLLLPLLLIAVAGYFGWAFTHP